MRTLAPPAAATLAGPTVALVLLLELGFEPTVYLASSAVPIDWNGNVYLGAGSLGSVDPVSDSNGQVEGLRFVLSGVPSENLSLALGVSARNKIATLRLAILNAATHAIEDVSTVGAYVLDQMPISDGPDTSAVGVTAYPLQTVFQRIKSLRYTDGDQKRLFPGDMSLEYLVSQSQHRDTWPSSTFFRKG